MKLDIPELDIPRIVIVGGGFGGIQLAKKLLELKVQVVLLDKNNFHTFQPLLYQVATAGLEAESIAYPIRKIFKNNPRFHFRLAEVEKINPEAKQIETSISKLNYDYLIIATGSVTNFMQNEGLIVSAMPMKSVLEALDLRSLILQNFEKALVTTNARKRQGMMNYVIAGGGPTGVELAGALGELKQHILPKDYPELDLSKMNIYLVQSNKRLLPALSEESSEITKGYLEALGVTVILKTRVLDFHGDYVQTNTEEDLIAKTLIWTAGVIGNPIEGLPKASVNKGGRIVVNDYNQVANVEGIFAIGDVACMESEEYPRGHPMVAPVAMQQGLLLAENIANTLSNKPLIPFEYNNKGAMATVGRNKAVVEIGNMKWKGAWAWLVWMVVHLLSLIGFRNKFVVMFNWLSNYFTYDRGIRLIINPFELSEKKKERKKELDTDN